jgi:competence protein ComEA
MAMTLAAQDQDEIKLLPDGPGKEATTRVCMDCHGTGNIRKMRLDRDAWADQVAEMVDRGAKATKADMDAVTDYLTANFGPDSKINVNTAPLIELKVVLGITAPEAKKLLDYREANGKFKDWDDLVKVNGVDAKKLEAKRAVVIF